MDFLKTKEWHWLDIGLLKWCAVIFGMILGAHIHEFVRQYEGFFVIAVIILAIKPMITYYKD